MPQSEEALYEDLQQELFPEDMTKAIIFADTRADDLFIAETLDRHIPKDTTVYLDWNTPLGQSVIRQRLDKNLPTGIIAYGPDHLAKIPEEIKNKLPHMELLEITPQSLSDLNARIILIPAMIGYNEIFIDASQDGMFLDFGPSTISSQIADNAQKANLALIMIDAPERGLVRFPKNNSEQDIHARRFFVLGLEPDAYESEEVIEGEIIEE